ncbi:MAG: hypothetical protein UT55_C0017G0006 [Candidatus Peregrinibacteria bacterium GW2011_GWE2_39_6]|nr:MAG: hypothetical protein UT36_C0004G0018 [Candidatus Peregrinibacteria bacterium GW2011_GWF2_39_17]KKR26110.1 MAG: hypothetical protein UT55_C0017G0006 [Candidatus Peregrinibacteria bacterium GW2011_GWE2_39_6]HCW32695.1 hypothetical protein [Candidatus Peregrinibacteria bacterium]
MEIDRNPGRESGDEPTERRKLDFAREFFVWFQCRPAIWHSACRAYAESKNADNFVDTLIRSIIEQCSLHGNNVWEIGDVFKPELISAIQAVGQRKDVDANDPEAFGMELMRNLGSFAGMMQGAARRLHNFLFKNRYLGNCGKREVFSPEMQFLLRAHTFQATVALTQLGYPQVAQSRIVSGLLDRNIPFLEFIQTSGAEPHFFYSCYAEQVSGSGEEHFLAIPYTDDLLLNSHSSCPLVLVVERTSNSVQGFDRQVSGTTKGSSFGNEPNLA